MQERSFKIQASEARLNVTLFDEAFRLKRQTENADILSRLKTVHRHSAYEIFFVLDGTLSIVCEGGTKHFNHAAVIVPPQFDHYAQAGLSEGYCMYFSVEDTDGETACALKNGITSLAIGEETRFYISRLAEIYEGSRPKEDALPLLTLLFSVLFRVFRHKEKNIPSTERTAKYGKYINTLDHYLSAHYCEPIRITDLANVLYLCPKQIARIIRKEYGCSFHELVHLKRLTAACMLLKYTDLKISEIASSLGYAHENYFYTRFRKRYGMTPCAYRDSFTDAEESNAGNP